VNALAALATARFAKGWRTYAVMAIVVILFLIENVAGVEVPGVRIGWNDVVLALGLGAAANHDT